MDDDSPEVKDAQEQQTTEERDFIQEFKMMTGPKLRVYEQENRSRIVEGSVVVRNAFDDKWRTITGWPYFQPVTTITIEDSTLKKVERMDPKSKGYKGWWEIIFSPKAKPDDPNDVTLALNGVCLQIKREAAVVLPGPYLEVADHGVYPTYIQLPGQDRKIAGHIKFFPYSVLREATEAEYLAQKKSGDKKTKAVREAETTT